MHSSSFESAPLRRDWSRFVALALLALLGAAYCHVLSLVQREVALGGNVTLACGGSAWFDCSHNLASRFGSLFGLPVSAYGAGWCLFVAAVLLGGVSRGQSDRTLYRACLFATLPAVGAVGFFAVISAAVLRSVCIYCTGVYALVLVMACLAARGAELDWEKIGQVAGRVARLALRWSVPVAAFAFALGAERWLAHRVGRQVSETTPIGYAPPRLGPRTAPLRLVVFSDFECPACRAGAKEMDRFLTRHAGEAELQVVSIPVRRMHNLATGDAVPASEYLGAALGVAMHRRGHFWEYYKGVFLSDRPVDETLLWDVTARTVGAQEIPAVTRELTEDSVRGALRYNAALAERYHVTKIPTYIVNGETVVGMMTADKLEARLAAARKRIAPTPTTGVASLAPRAQ